ncbi:beta-ketoacyl-[acyl-carrier-protein] synthase family protein [Neolewinella antarctica]|uniref:3-oxoacyl-(Acyl-carrier-protein) synthase n=1 Tax=Neolewinella antarctica TaxID=442734 RepID=A0ABX0XDZ1_9BACT|nr:beta-ketoacyl synthase [Neolewinella antarctica]NJC27118.1 3-oxoacyl-(acyl-carrier-protein) synthase [Neolewinella antarctica]
MSQRVKLVINGRGSISAAGNDPAAAYQTWGKDTATWSVEASTGLPVYRVTNIPEHEAIERFARRRSADRATLLALHAADQAVRQAGWVGQEFAILVGCSRGPTGSWEDGYEHFRETGTARTKTSPQTTLGGIGFALADYFGTRSLTTGMSVTCSSGFHALVHAVALLRAGMAERVLVGGAEAPLTPFTLRQMEAMGIYASVPERRKHACDPLGKPASGMVIGEGAAFVALSTEGSGPTLMGIGFGREQVASATGISREGEALQASMTAALAEAGIPCANVVLHAPGTDRGDDAEQKAIHAVMGSYDNVDGIFNKHLTGHTFGASGPLGLDFALSVLENDRGYPHHSLLVNATGFGGNAVSVVVKGE